MVKLVHDRLAKIFPIKRVYQTFVPSYPSGWFLLGFASKKYDYDNIDADKFNSLGIKTQYYNPEVHLGAFALPNSLNKLVNAIPKKSK
jgi:spermidine synthase